MAGDEEKQGERNGRHVEKGKRRNSVTDKGAERQSERGEIEVGWLMDGSIFSLL